MPSYCAAYNCSNYINKESGLSCHKFPKDPELRQQWILATNRKEFNPSKTSCLCSVHFEESAFEVGGLRRRLKKDAVPTLFQFSPKLVTKRSKRMKRMMEASSLDCEINLRNSNSPDLLTPKIEIKEEVEIDKDEWMLQAQTKEELLENDEELEPIAFVCVPSLSKEFFEEEY